MSHRFFSTRKTTSSHGGRRAPRAWQDPALWAWVAVAVFALLPLTHVMAAPLAAPGDHAADAPMAGMPMGRLGDVKAAVAAPHQDQASAAGDGTL